MPSKSSVSKIKLFVSSVQSELASERDCVSYIITHDPSLDEYLEPVLYENAPASSAVAINECVDLVGTCQVFVLIVGQKAGFMVDRRSITHAEFHKARELHQAGGMDILVFRKKLDGPRDKGAESLLEDVRQTGVKYKEYATPSDFRNEFIAALKKLLREKLAPADAARAMRSAKQTMEQASAFETERSSVPLTDIDYDVARRLISAWDDLAPDRLSKEDLEGRLVIRGHLHRTAKGRLLPTRLGALVLAKDPTMDRNLANAVIMAEAYSGTSITARPRDQRLITGFAESMVAQALEFVSRNTRHPDRVVGMRRFTLDEYPKEAVREAIVNAIAHRSYEDIGSRVRLQVLSDRIVVASPGAVPAPLTTQRLKSGAARARSRNPLLAQSLYRLNLMENRGSGIRRIRESGEAHGLKGFEIEQVDGYLELSLLGVGNDIDALPLPRELLEAVLPASRRDQLNPRQRDMAERLGRGETLTSRYCEDLYQVSRDTTSKDFQTLIDEGVAQRVGLGRSTRYLLVGLTRT